jgi:hypothetical protein
MAWTSIARLPLGTKCQQVDSRRWPRSDPLERVACAAPAAKPGCAGPWRQAQPSLISACSLTGFPSRLLRSGKAWASQAHARFLASRVRRRRPPWLSLSTCLTPIVDYHHINARYGRFGIISLGAPVMRQRSQPASSVGRFQIFSRPSSPKSIVEVHHATKRTCEGLATTMVLDHSDGIDKHLTDTSPEHCSAVSNL